MPYILDRDGVFEVRKSSMEGAGNGVFCVEGVESGTILPYYAVSFKESRAPEDLDRTFVISADFNNSKGSPRTSSVYSVDGNPLREPVASLEEYKKLGCQINEASHPSKPNCMFCVNPLLTKDSFKGSLVNQVPIVSTYVVVTEDLEPGTELLTSYGDEYSDREYTPCKLSRKEHDAMVDKAYEIVDCL